MYGILKFECDKDFINELNFDFIISKMATKSEIKKKKDQCDAAAAAVAAMA